MIRNLFVSLVFIVTLVSCSPSHDSAIGLASGDAFILNPNPNPALRSAAQTVLTNRCFSCHGPSGSNTRIFEASGGNVDMDALLQNQRYVAIGEPDASFLYQAIFTINMPVNTPEDSFLGDQQEQDDIALWLADIGIPNPDDVGPPPVTAATFTEVEDQVLTPHCYSCHATAGPPGRPVFSDFASVRATMVLPNNPDSAFLRVIKSTTPSEVMPPGANGPLLQTQIDLVESWVLDGAQNN